MAKIALCVGHSRRGDRTGALNTHNVSEYAFNRHLARHTAAILRERGHDPLVIDDYQKLGYSAAMCWLADAVKDFGADVAVEFHFNSAGPFATGHEWLHWHSSVRGQALAQSFNKAFKAAFPKARARGVKPISEDDRGGGFLRRTHCPAVILEPFFGSNKEETDHYTRRSTKLAQAYAEALDAYFRVDNATPEN